MHGIIIPVDEARERVEEDRKKLITQRNIKRILNVTISAALQMLHQNVIANKTMASESLKIVARWANRCVASTLDAWHDHTVEEERKRNLITRIVQRLQRSGVVLALNMWYSKVVLLVQDQEEEDRRNYILRKVHVRMMHSSMSSAFETWSDCLVQQKLEYRSKKITEDRGL